LRPGWLRALEEALAGGARGFILVFNVTDRVVSELGPPCGLMAFINRYLGGRGYQVATYALNYGLRGAGLDSQDEPHRLFPRLTDRLRRREGPPFALVVDYADHLVPAAQGLSAVLTREQLAVLETLHGWGNDDAIRAGQNLVILISYENQVNELLRQGGSGYRTIRVELPGPEERAAFLGVLFRSRFKCRLEADLSVEELTRLTGGLRLIDIEGLFRRAAASGEALTRAAVREEKARVIRQLAQDLVEVYEPTYGFEAVAGLRHAVGYFEALKAQVRAGSQSVPQAVLLAGVPGCGKSFLVLALARELGYPCLAMRNIRDKWVGASERNLELVLWLVETLAPCVVWVDELDQALGQRSAGPSADAGTSERMLARIWEFMGAMRHRGRVLWVATTNRPDLLDPATLDRFPVVIPFLHPTPDEVAALLPALARQLGRTLAEGVDPRAVAATPNLRLPTVRGLQEVVAWAGFLADGEAGRPGAAIGQAHLEAAARDFKPNYNRLEHEFIALTALNMTSFNSLLPWFHNGGRVPDYLAGLVGEDGSLDPEKLQARLAELRLRLAGRFGGGPGW
jgi:transitional endoplasmic reticulum ATPase